MKALFYSTLFLLLFLSSCDESDNVEPDTQQNTATNSVEKPQQPKQENSLGHETDGELNKKQEKENGQKTLAEPKATRDHRIMSDSAQIMTKADEIIAHLAQKNLNAVANYAHPKKGVTISPYSFIQNNPVFTSTELKDFSPKKETNWGIEDGTGDDIKLAFEAYHKRYLFSRNYQQPDTIIYNELKQRGNSLHNGNEQFPDAIPVEFHLYGTSDMMEMDWGSLILFFEQNNDNWYLVAIVNNRYTV